MPATAHCDDMEASPIPEELKKLNVLKRHLMSAKLPFMKIIALPKQEQ